MRTPTLEEVKNHFKNAKIVKCAYDEDQFDLEIDVVGDIYFYNEEYWMDTKSNFRTNLQVWSEDIGYADILSYKTDSKTKISEFIKEKNPTARLRYFLENFDYVEDICEKHFSQFRNCGKKTKEEFYELLNSINKSTTQISDSNEERLKYIDVALRLANIQLNQELLVKVLKVVDLVNEKGGKVSVEDIVKL